MTSPELAREQSADANTRTAACGVHESDILRSIADGVLVLDRDGKVLCANHTMCETLEASAEQLASQPLTELLSETELLGLLGVDDAVTDGEPAWLQVVFRTLSGNYVPLSVTLSVLKHAEGGYVLVCRDQTEIRELLTDSSRVAAEEVERRVQLQREKDDAETRERMQLETGQALKLEAIGQLAAGIAHEINTPIQFIGDNVTFLSRAFGLVSKVVDQAQVVAAADPEKLEAALAGLKPAIRKAKLDFIAQEVPTAISQTLEGVARVAKIVSALKEVSHPSGGQRQEVDLHRLIESAVTVARNEWKYVATMSMDFGEDFPQVPCFSDDISQVILNVVVNAAHAIGDAIDPNAGELGEIRIATSHDPDWAVIRIADSGTGMPDHVKRRIFDPFFTTKEVGKGTGQGLSMAYNVIVKKHGGSIDVETAPGNGTTFVIRLPMNPEVRTSQEPALRPDGGTP